MLTAYFDIQNQPGGVGGGGGQTFGKQKKGTARAPKPARQPKPPKAPRQARQARQPRQPPRPTEASTTSVHARFDPLPPETNVPRPAEVPHQQGWQALSGSGVVRDDDVAEFNREWDGSAWEDEQQDELGELGELDEREELGELDEASEPDFEPESLDLSLGEVEPSLSSSVDDDRVLQTFFKRHRAQSTPVYSGPQLCCEDDDFDD